jgi:hypothetical protein
MEMLFYPYVVMLVILLPLGATGNGAGPAVISTMLDGRRWGP